MNTDKLVYDYIVVGSGAAGGVVFDELKKKNKNVLLVEKGPYIKSENLKKEFFYSLKKIWKSSGYQYAGGNISLPILQGNSLGGSTTINGSIMQSLDESFCNKIIDHANIKNHKFKFNNLLTIQDELRKEFNIQSRKEEFPENNILLSEIKKRNWQCKFLERALSGESDSGKVLSGNSIEKTILRKYQGENILSDTEVKLIIKHKSKILGIICYSKKIKKNFL